MHNHYHPTTTRALYSSGIAVSNDLKVCLKRFIRKNRIETILLQARKTIGYLLSTLTISGLFLAAIYLFLSQLAAHGW